MGLRANLTLPDARGVGAPSLLLAAGGALSPKRLGATLLLYAFLSKPRVVGLLLLVSVIAYVVAGQGALVATRLALLMSAGGLSAAGAGMLNQYLERDVDALMPRTRDRPLAAGRITAPQVVMWVGTGLVIVGTALGFALGPLVGLMIGTGAAVYVLLYTRFMKRRTHWSVVVGGISGSCAVMAGWLTGGPPSLAALSVAGLLFTWQSAHFWPLALAREDDYARAGVPMLPAVIGTRRTGTWIFLASAATVVISLTLAATGDFGALYLTGSLVAAGLWLGSTGRLLIDASPGTARRAFKASGVYLAFVFSLMFLDVVFAA